MKKALFSLFCMAMSVMCYGQSVDFHRFTLPCGAKVLLHRNPYAPVVSIAVAYKTGLNDQPSTLKGVNRMVIDMRSNSSRHMSDGEYNDILKTYGSRSSASVGYDVTFFCDNFSSNMLRGAIWLAAEKTADYVDDTLVMNKYLEIEKKNARPIKMEKQDMDLLYEMVRTVNIRLNPDMTAHNTLDAEAVRACEKLYFQPEKAVIAISGMIDIDSTENYVRDFFAFLPELPHEQESTATVFTVNNAPKDSVLTIDGQVLEVGSGILSATPQSMKKDTVYRAESAVAGLKSIIMAWQIPPYTDPQYEVFDFIATVLTGQGSRLNNALISQSDMAVSVQDMNLPMGRASVFAVKATAHPDVTLEQIEHVITDEIEKLKTTNISPSELQKAINTCEMSMWQNISTNEGMARYLANAELMFGNASILNSKLDRIRRITADEVREVVKRFLRTDNMKITYILPSNSKNHIAKK
ncbi:MAG: insulinase family protein [Flavobacteriales bacterium]|nr:insulinase family protein [Flavobacteriales bacterium]